MKTTYTPHSERYASLPYKRTGRSGLKLPTVSLGLWQNFGRNPYDSLERSRAMIYRAFDLGITHFDLANNYGPPSGSAEETFGTILAGELGAYRDELVISSKAGYTMWPGPYGDWGSRKYLIASADQSLRRMGLDYVDIFYSHRYDPDTPLEETMGALATLVKQGKALYAGISNYPAHESVKAAEILEDLGTPCLIHQVKYSMLDRGVEGPVLEAVNDTGMGCITFSPLAQGLLTDKYLEGVPEGSRAGRSGSTIRPDRLTPEMIERIRRLDQFAHTRGESLAQLAVSWILRLPEVTSVLIGASRVSQIEEAVEAAGAEPLTPMELLTIETLLSRIDA